MSKIDFYHVNYENLATNPEPATPQNHLFQHGVYLDRAVDVLALGKLRPSQDERPLADLPPVAHCHMRRSKHGESHGTSQVGL